MKSMEVLFNEALEMLDKAGKRAKFDAKATKLTTIESKLNCAEAILKESRVVRKHNGAADNFVESSPFSGEYFTEGYVQTTDNSRKADSLIVESLRHPDTRQPITAEQKRMLLGEKPAEYANLNEAQRREYDFARSIKISEADSLRLALMVR